MPFILLATQRTGSSWAQEMLHSHPALKVYSELFLPDARGMPMWEPSDFEFAASFVASRSRPPAVLTRRYWTIQYLRRLFDQRDQVVGFKYMYDQIPHSPEVLAYAAAARVPVVHLIRRNLLDTVISAKRAEVSRMYHVPTDGRQPIPWLTNERAEVRVRIGPEELLSELARLARERRRIQSWLRLSRTPTLEIEYEALVADPSRFREILGFVGVGCPEAPRLQSGLAKVRLEPRSQALVNYAELQSALSGTPFEVFLTG
jgi:LPS sulfotransferase NodH